MKTAIVFASKKGTTEKCAKLLAEKIPDATVFDLKDNKNPELDEFHTIIVGTSVYVGKANKRVLQFLDKYNNKLLAKRIGLFMCCMHEPAERQKQFDQTYNAQIRSRATAKAFFGGRFDFSKMNFLERLVIRMGVKIKESVDKIDYKAIDEFAKTIQS